MILKPKVPENIKENGGEIKAEKVSHNFWTKLGPGLITGAADDDPSGIATYSQTGAQFGFALLWLASFTFPLMAAVQEMCARIGMVTGRGLAGNIRLHYSKKVLYLCTGLLFLANVFNIGADLGAMAKAGQLIIPSLSYSGLIIFFTVVSLVVQIFTSYKTYARYLKYLALILFAYVLSAFFVHFNVKDIALGALVPHLTFNRSEIFLVCAILGTTISPYLFFWQTSQEVEEEILSGKTSIKERQAITTDVEIKKMRVDVWFGMFFSNVVMFFIIAVCAATLYAHGLTNIQTAAQAAAALGPIAGKYASLLFSLGILGTGFLAVPILAGSTSYAMAESFKWKEGLYRKFGQAHSFYAVIIAAMLLGLFMNFTGIDPIKALIYSAVLNGIIAPIILILIVQISGDHKIMGARKNKPWVSAVGWIVTTLMLLVSVATLASLIFPS